MSDKRNKVLIQDEEKFLKSYCIEDYDRPSVTTDVVVFTMFSKTSECHRKDAEPKLSVLLIKRGEHPFLNSWALPGGFLKMDETVEECAQRELKEETNLLAPSLIPVGVFSDPERDPRGRIISNSFATVISEDNVKLHGGGDSKDAKWFSVDLKYSDNKQWILSLKNGTEEIFAKLIENENKLSTCKFEVELSTGLAFDHAKIIATALNELKEKAEGIDVALDFLPEKFTLASLQKVQETLLGISLLSANFRRKISQLVEETDEYTEGVGHRPARLFKRK